MAAGDDAYFPIETQTLSSNQASIVFGAGGTIPQTYTDLVIASQAGCTSSGQAFLIRVGNGTIDSTTKYSYTFTNGTGTSAFSGGYNTQGAGVLAWSSPSAAVQDFGLMNLMSYSSTIIHKSLISRYNNASTGTDLLANLWRSTSAINIIEIYPTAGNILSGSTFTLYGIKAA
jgi:hypothetical protein